MATSSTASINHAAITIGNSLNNAEQAALDYAKLGDNPTSAQIEKICKELGLSAEDTATIVSNKSTSGLSSLVQAKFQKAQNAYQFLSNLLKSMKDTAMAVIQNLRT